MAGRVQIVPIKTFTDERGHFSPVKKIGEWAMNESFSKRGVFRGLHIQTPAQRKEVRVVTGRIIDIWVDKGGVGNAIELDPRDGVVMIPEGYLHGFLAVEDSIVQYFVKGPYRPSGERAYNLFSPGIVWDDESWDLITDARLKLGTLILSEKDKGAINWRGIKHAR